MPRGPRVSCYAICWRRTRRKGPCCVNLVSYFSARFGYHFHSHLNLFAGLAVRCSSRNPGDEKTLQAVAKAATSAAHGGSVSASSTSAGISESSVVLLSFPSEIAATAESIKALAESLGDVSGKIIIDVTNPLVKGQLGELHYGGESSGGEEFAKALPSAHVYKAFNTVGIIYALCHCGVVCLPAL